MPELPEVETTRRGIAPYVENKTIESLVVRQRQLRWPIPAALKKNISGKTVVSLERRAKYLLFVFEHGTLLIHLGMSGSLRISSQDTELRKHDHVIFTLANNKQLRFHDPRRFGCVLWHTGDITQHKLIANLGPEPLSTDFNADLLFKASRKRSVAIKNFIMNANIVVGVGNIYASEALFLSGIRPTRQAGKVTRKQYALLCENIKLVLEKSIHQGGTTLRDFVNSAGEPGYFKQSLNVYGRENENCHVCTTPIKQKRIDQRSSFYCPQCQK